MVDVLFVFFLIVRRPPVSTRTYTLFPSTTPFRSVPSVPHRASPATRRCPQWTPAARRSLRRPRPRASAASRRPAPVISPGAPPPFAEPPRCALHPCPTPPQAATPRAGEERACLHASCVSARAPSPPLRRRRTVTVPPAEAHAGSRRAGAG